jgi:ketosteroid isomerase-like protein
MSTAAVGATTTQEVANRFHELAQSGNRMQIQEELFSDDAESVEPSNSPGLQNAKGRDGLKQKGEMFNSMVEEMHGGYSSEPIVAGNFFAVAMGMEATMKGQGRSKMDEIALYEVRDGKIIKEQFFY